MLFKNSFRCVHSLLITLFCVACGSGTEQGTNAPPTPEPEASATVLSSAEVIRSVRQALNEAGDYEVQLLTRANSGAMFPDHSDEYLTTTRTELKVRRPSQAYVSMQLHPEDPARSGISTSPIVVLFDGETIWTLRANGPAMRLDQQRLAGSDRPLDSRYQIRGAGLLPQKDLIDTVRSFFDEYTFAPNATTSESEGRSVHRLVGEMTIDEAIERFMSDPDRVAGISAILDSASDELRRDLVAMQLDMNAASINTTRRITLSIDGATSLPCGWTFGREDAAIDTKVERFDTQAVFDDTVFTIPEADQQNAVDQTDAYLEQLARLTRSTPPSAERIEEIRAALHAAVQRVIGGESPTTPVVR